MHWYELLNLGIIFTTLTGAFYLFIKDKQFPKIVQQSEVSDLFHVLLPGLVLVQFYDVLTAIAWARNGVCDSVLGVPKYLYAVAAITKNIYFMGIILCSVFWLTKQIARQHGK